MQIFETGTGTFKPLSDEQLATLNEAQTAAYNELASLADVLAHADTEVESAKAQVNADMATLSEAERNAPCFDASAAHTALVKQMIASNRPV